MVSGSEDTQDPVRDFYLETASRCQASRLDSMQFNDDRCVIRRVLSSPAVYAVTSAALLLIAIAACIIPAQRAARIDPVVALHNE